MVGRTIAYRGRPHPRRFAGAAGIASNTPGEVFRAPTCYGTHLIPKTTGRYPNRSLLARYSSCITWAGHLSSLKPAESLCCLAMVLIKCKGPLKLASRKVRFVGPEVHLPEPVATTGTPVWLKLLTELN